MLSVVVPAYNEARALPRTLAALLAEPGAREVIVVDGGSDDGTFELAASFPGVRVTGAERGRASQMNAGAHDARGEWLLFLHADTCLPEGALGRLEAFLARAGCGGGAFRHRFRQRHWLLALVSAGNNLRCRLSRVYLGDQAIFVRAEAFRRLGGFPEVPVLEDVIFSERLRRAEKTVLLPEAAVTDARRFLEQGIVRTTARGIAILARHKLGLPVDGRGYREAIR